MAIGPRILGHATDLIFAGLIGSRLPAGRPRSRPSTARASAATTGRRHGQRPWTSCPARVSTSTPSAHVLLLVLGDLRRGLGCWRWLQGYLLNDVVQGTVRRMRADVEDKINRLPLGYFDRQPRGELLSRVTNDIDNVSQTLQQTMSQLLTSLLTVVAVLSMMFWISPLLALVALVSVPLSMFVTARS